jgi:tetratricopeptide (TPR) repeat protein
MDCQRVADGELLEKYLNGQLDPAMQDDLEVHLLSCSQCLAHAETLKTIRAGLATAAQPAYGTAVRRVWSLTWVRVGVAVALVVLGAAGIYRFRQSMGKPEQTAHHPTQAPPTPPVASNENQAGNGQHSSDHLTQRAEKKNSRPETKRGPGEREEQEAKITPDAQVGTGQPAPDTGSSKPGNARKEAPARMSEENAVELYRLAAVQAPPYTAGQTSGSTGPGTEPGSKPSTSFSSGAGAGRAFFQQGMLAYVEGRYQDAARLLEKSLESQPHAVAANFYLGVCRLLQGHAAESVAPLKEALAGPASSFTQSAHFYLAKAYLQMSRLEDAEHEMQAAAALNGSLTAEAQSLATRIHALRTQGDR